MGGYLWAISSIAAEKIQVRCLTETYIAEIKSIPQIIYIEDRCEGYSPSLAIAAKTEITSNVSIDSRVRFFISFNAEYQENELIGVWPEISVDYLTKEEVDEIVEQLPESEPLNFEDIHSTILNLKEYPYEIKQWMILTVLGIIAMILTVILIIIIWKIYHMRGALGQIGEVFNIVKDEPNLSGLLEVGKVAQKKLQSTAPASSSERSPPKEPIIKPDVATPLYQAIVSLRETNEEISESNEEGKRNEKDSRGFRGNYNRHCLNVR